MNIYEKKHNIIGNVTGAFNDAVNEFEYKIRLTERIEMTKEGYAIFRDAIFGNVGILRYSERELGWSNQNRPVKVLRDEVEVFDEHSLSSLEGKPVTFLHPNVDVDSRNFKELGKGTVLGKPRRVGDNIVGDIIIHDEELVDLILIEVDLPNGSKTRKLNDEFRDLSLGYKATLVKVDNDLYKQTNIIYNHLAVVPQGRQANATIRDSDNENMSKEESQKMPTFLEKLFKKGKKVVRDEKGITILDEETEVLIDEEEKLEDEKETKVEKENVKGEDSNHENEVKDEKDQEKDKEKEEKEKEKPMKDRKYFIDALKEAQALPDGVIKTSMIDNLNKEYAETFPTEVKTGGAFQDAKPVNSSELDKNLRDTGAPQVKPLRFEEVEQINRDYYRKLTDPTIHKDWKAFNDHFNEQRRKGKEASALL